MIDFSKKNIAAASVCLLAAFGMAHAQTTGTAPASGSDTGTTRSMQGTSPMDRPAAGTPGSDPYPPQVGTQGNANARRDGGQDSSPGYGNQGSTTTPPAAGQYPNSNGNGAWNNARPARGDRG